MKQVPQTVHDKRLIECLKEQQRDFEGMKKNGMGSPVSNHLIVVIENIIKFKKIQPQECMDLLQSLSMSKTEKEEYLEECRQLNFDEKESLKMIEEKEYITEFLKKSFEVMWCKI